MLIATSRNVSEWLAMGSPVESGGDAYIEGNPIDRNVLAGLIAIGIFVLFQRRRKVGELLRANAPILLFFAYCLVSVLWSDFPFVGLKRWVRGIGDVVMVLVVLTDGDWRAARDRVLAWAGFVVLPLSVLFIRYYPDLGRIYGAHDGKFYWTGVGTSKNELGLICMVFGIAYAANFLDAYRVKETMNRSRLMMVHGFMFVMALWLVRMADSATSFACLSLGVEIGRASCRERV
jgi:exopolysaccharide production protein ExoQ